MRDGVRLLPQEVSKLRYEDLRQILVDHYREHYPSAITTTDKDGKAHFAGSQHLDKFFRNVPILEITAIAIKDFINWRRKRGHKDATIRRQLTPLRSAFQRAKDLDLLTDNHIPSFVLPRDSEPREGFLDLKTSISFSKNCL